MKKKVIHWLTLIPAFVSGKQRVHSFGHTAQGPFGRAVELHVDPEALHESVDDGAQQVRREHPEPVADLAAADDSRPTGTLPPAASKCSRL